MSRLPLAAPDDLIAKRYRVARSLGEGRSGEVYEAIDEHLGTNVAIKLLLPQPGATATWDEARMLTQLASEYLLPVYNADVDWDSDVRYITMPVMRGGDLDERARVWGATPSLVRRWGSQIAVGLEKMHDSGLVHRDIKPGNVFLDERESAILGDLGLAASLNRDRVAPVDGTWVTLAPEAAAKGCTVATDIYSLGATVFFALSGEYPVYNRGSEDDVARRVMSGDRRRLRDLAPHVSQSMAGVVERALAFDPRQRQGSALEFANQLGRTSPHRREWRKSPCSPDHQLCFAGGPYRNAQGVRVCVIPVGSKWDIEIFRTGGRRVRRGHSSLSWGQVLVHLRDLTKSL